MDQGNDAPLILTLEFDPATQDWAQNMRSTHFPAARNIVPAHVTLFHALPSSCRGRIGANLAWLGDAPEITIGAPYLLGRGVAYAMTTPELARLRADLVSVVGRERLTRQDAASWRPHLTVQNKVSPEQARALLADLQTAPHPVTCHAVALRLWRYEGGPWTLLERFAFITA
ncbi:2'-5' RNA ligase family protein [Asaia bogorensis]|uniref:2'-5' RNA ligase family protein n=1 Tax=Asaia bogorensis TaxID=91915 RepID=UPI00285BD26D|nr:2'-5' RNA ligase family protein [Asaia bogorensis]MDR6182503.1 hypothetical protein [Asaia bogorensis NBRC 16594]